MNLAMVNGFSEVGFAEMNEQEMMLVDGGAIEWAAIGAAAVEAAKWTGALFGAGPVGGAIALVGGTALLVTGICIGVANN